MQVSSQAPIHSLKPRVTSCEAQPMASELLIVKSVSQVASPRPVSTPIKAYTLVENKQGSVTRPALQRKTIAPAATINLFDYVDGPRRKSTISVRSIRPSLAFKQHLSRGFSLRNIRLAGLLESHTLVRERTESVLSVISSSLRPCSTVRVERPRTGQGVKTLGVRVRKGSNGSTVRPLLAVQSQDKLFPSHIHGKSGFSHR